MTPDPMADTYQTHQRQILKGLYATRTSPIRRADYDLDNPPKEYV